MTAITVEREHDVEQTYVPARKIPTSRVISVELRKMFDTRAGFWLMASIVIAAVGATTAVILFAPDDELTYNSFAAAIGFPMTVILPMIAILAVTGEWSQRTGLTTFTLVPTWCGTSRSPTRRTSPWPTSWACSSGSCSAC